jgi:homocysteine S-methyltransferase
MSSSSSSSSPKLSLRDWCHSSSDTLLSPASQSIILMDGGVSTHLENLIAPTVFSHRALWSSSLLLTETGKAKIIQGHHDWLESGCNIITTVTYQCHYGLVVDDNEITIDTGTGTGTGTGKDDSDRSDLDNKIMPPREKMTGMIKDGIAFAKQAIACRRAMDTSETSTATSSFPLSLSSSSSSYLGPFVVASTGPYGAAMANGEEYTGKYPSYLSRQALVDFHTQKARTLLQEYPDGLAVETIPNLEEVGVVCEVLRELQLQQQQQGVQPGKKSVACWISFACHNENELNDGHTIEEAFRCIKLHDPTGHFIDAIGINCCDSIFIASLVKKLTKSIHLETSSRGGSFPQQRPRGIIIYPNSGELWNASNEEWKDGTGTTDKQFSDRLMEAVKIVQDTWTNENVLSKRSICMPKMILGGCCRTNPATIVTIRNRIDAYNHTDLTQQTE